MLLSLCLLVQFSSTQTDWTGGRGAAGPVGEFGTAFLSCDSVTYNVTGQISPVACSTNLSGWIKHTIERYQKIDGHGGLYPADFDGDGDLDLAGWVSLACSMRFYQNYMVESDSVGYRARVTYGAPSGSKGKYGQIWAGDINGDGRPDVAVVCSTRVFWYENRGNFSFTLHDLGAAIHPEGAVEGADVNCDGLMDLVVGDKPLEVWYQQPGGTFRRDTVWSGEKYKILVGNINNDRWPDLLAEDQVFLNNMGEYPSVPTWSAGLSGPDGIWIRDFNNDALPDLLICDQWSSTPSLYWYENLGNGTSFRAHRVVRDPVAKQYGDGACAEDVDGDGRTDIVGSYSRVGFFRQVTPDSFTCVELDTITDSHWIRTANLDYKPNGSDVDIDILVAGRGQYAWYENAGQLKYSCNGWLVSSVLDAGVPTTWRMLAWDAARPVGTRLDLYVRSGVTPAQCTTREWSSAIAVRVGVEIDSADITQHTGASDRYFQYRVVMGANNGRVPGLTPAVYSIRVVFDQRGYYHDVGTTEIVAPGPVVDTVQPVSVSATVANFGVDTETFYTLFTIERTNGTPVYRDSLLTTLPPGAVRQRMFREFRFAESGPYVVRCSTRLPADENRGNDALLHVTKALRRPNWPTGWHEAKQMPQLPSGKPVKRGGWLTSMAGSGLFYVAKGNKTGDFYQYRPLTDSWQTCQAMPAGVELKLPSAGAAGTSDGHRYVFATKGNNTLGFWLYDAVADSWQQLPDIPRGPYGKKAKSGTDVAFVHESDTDYVYLLKGTKNEFYRYNIAARRWDTRPDAPIGISSIKWDRGSWLVYDGVRYLYAHKGKYSELWRYDTQTEAWLDSMLPGIPTFNPRTNRVKRAKDGSSAAWDSCVLYAVKGGNTQDFWRFDAAGDSWTALDTIPTVGTSGRRVKVKEGADLATFGQGVVYLLKGGRTCEFWRYALSLEIVAPEPDRGAAALGQTMPLHRRIMLAPNPAVGRTLSLLTDYPGQCRVQVSDISGRIVRSTSLIPRAGCASLTVAGLPAGVYPVLVQTGTAAWRTKLVLK
jgi:hypothetical protein